MKKLKIFFIFLIFTNAIAANTVNIIIFENKSLNDFMEESQSSTLLYQALDSQNVTESFQTSNLLENFYSIKDNFVIDAMKQLEKKYQIIYKNRVILKNQKILNLNYYNNHTSIIGKILIKKNKFYDLSFDINVIKNNYQLKMQQTVRSNKDKLNYVDHPFIGILFYVE